MATSLLDIKNTYAQEQGYEDWVLFVHEVDNEIEMEDHMNEICIRAQKAALEKAAENGVAYKLSYPNNTSKAVVEKESITNKQNLIL